MSDFGTAKRLQYLMDNDPELRRLAEGPGAVAPRSEGLAAIGTPYRLGNGWLRPLKRDALLSMRAIDSPLLGRIEDAQPIDAYRALYAVAAGPLALRRVMAFDQRLKVLESQKGLASGSPEMLRAYLEQVSALTAETWGKFDEEALAFAVKEFGDVSPVDVLNVLAFAIRDAIGSLGGTEKKTEPTAASTPTGSGMSTWCARVWGWIPRPCRWLGCLRWWRRTGGRAEPAAGEATRRPSTGSDASEK